MGQHGFIAREVVGQRTNDSPTPWRVGQVHHAPTGNPHHGQRERLLKVSM